MLYSVRKNFSSDEKKESFFLEMLVPQASPSGVHLWPVLGKPAGDLEEEEAEKEK